MLHELQLLLLPQASTQVLASYMLQDAMVMVLPKEISSSEL